MSAACRPPGARAAACAQGRGSRALNRTRGSASHRDACKQGAQPVQHVLALRWGPRGSEWQDHARAPTCASVHAGTARNSLKICRVAQGSSSVWAGWRWQAGTRGAARGPPHLDGHAHVLPGSLHLRHEVGQLLLRPHDEHVERHGCCLRAIGGRRPKSSVPGKTCCEAHAATRSGQAASAAPVAVVQGRRRGSAGAGGAHLGALADAERIPRSPAAASQSPASADGPAPTDCVNAASRRAQHWWPQQNAPCLPAC